MIKVIMNNDSVIISGHANFNDYGKDIVCAAVSSIVTACTNNIYTVNPSSLRYNDDGDKITIEIVRNDDLVFKLLNNLKDMLIDLSETYPKNIMIERED